MSKPSNDLTLFVYHVPQHVDNDTLALLFAPFGALTRSEVQYKKGAESKGFAFVAYGTRQEAENAKAAMHGYQMPDAQKAFRISFVGEKAEEPPQNLVGGGGARKRPLDLAPSPAYNTMTAMGGMGGLGAMGGMGAMQSFGSFPAEKRSRNDTMLPSYGGFEMPLVGMGDMGLTGQFDPSLMQYGATLPYTAAFPQYMQPPPQFSLQSSGTASGGSKRALDDPKNQPDKPTNELFVFYVPQEMGDAELQAMFEGYAVNGKIKRAQVAQKKDGTGQHKGFGFVTFEQVPDAVNALNGTHGTAMSNGKNLRVTYQKQELIQK